MKNGILQLFSLALFFMSCTATYNVTVHADHSATVQTIGLDSADLVRYSSSPMISGLDTNEAGIVFKVNTVDSLGNYLSPLQAGFIQFRMDSTSLTITEGNGNVFKENPAGRACCHVSMDIQFEQDVKAVNSPNTSAVVSDTNQIHISRDNKELRKGKDKLNVTVELGKTDSVPTWEFGKWGGGLEVGAGVFFISGAAKGSMEDGMTYGSVALTISYTKFHFMLQTGSIAGNLRQDLEYGPEWKQGQWYSSAHHQLSVGYELVCTKNFNVVPLVSGGIVRFGTRTNAEENVWVDSRYSPTYSVGAAFDFKMNSPLKKNREPGREYTMNYVYFRLATGIYPTYFKNPLGLSGSMYFANLSVGFYVGGRRECR
jgi:hypothetical protein